MRAKGASTKSGRAPAARPPAAARSEQSAAARQAFPLRALLLRLGKRPLEHPWSEYLPDNFNVAAKPHQVHAMKPQAAAFPPPNAPCVRSPPSRGSPAMASPMSPLSSATLSPMSPVGPLLATSPPRAQCRKASIASEVSTEDSCSWSRCPSGGSGQAQAQVFGGKASITSTSSTDDWGMGLADAQNFGRKSSITSTSSAEDSSYWGRIATDSTQADFCLSPSAGAKNPLLVRSDQWSRQASSADAVAAVAGRVWRLAQDPQGCRKVQVAIEGARHEKERAALLSELKGHVLEALRCPHANHVIQKCITTSKPADSQFIIEELEGRHGAISQAARHKYGCRIIQRLLEHCLPQQVRGLVEVLVADGPGLACHPYGNYVMQHLLEHGAEDQQCRAAQALQEQVLTIAKDTYGAAVVSAAMCHAGAVEQQALARALLEEPCLLTFLACSRHGHLAARMAVQVLLEPDQRRARAMLQAEASALSASRYGRIVSACLDF